VFAISMWPPAGRMVDADQVAFRVIVLPVEVT
jgi:hypothetical protein